MLAEMNPNIARGGVCEELRSLTWVPGGRGDGVRGAGAGARGDGAGRVAGLR